MRSETPTYDSWAHMKGRCLNPNDDRFSSYGGRGITVCERWMLFENFLADMGERPEGLSIDRIDNDGNYEPSNCRWATASQQMNNRRTNHFLEHGGQRKTVTEWSRNLGVSHEVIRTRIRRGWDVDAALTRPVLHKDDLPESLNTMHVRLYEGDKELFEGAAKASGYKAMSEWIRDTLRAAANGDGVPPK